MTEGSVSACPPAASPAGDEDVFVFPASFAQRRLWLIDRIDPGSTAYNVPDALRLDGALDAAALEASIGEIVGRHEALRTTFEEMEGEPMQIVSPEHAFHLPLVDFTALPEQEREAEAQRAMNAETVRRFDLARGPLFHASLLRLSAERHILLTNSHHIVADAWSARVFARELSELYGAWIAGRPAQLPELAIQYADFAEWQRASLTGAVLEKHLGYWRGKLADMPTLELPLDHRRPAMQTSVGATEEIVIPAEVVDALKALSRRESTTLFMTMLAAYSALLARHTGQEDIAVGSPITSRSRRETEPLIGFFLNTLVLRTSLAGDPTFRELLGRARETALGAFAHQDLPFEMLVEDLRPERNPSRNPLCQAMLVVLPEATATPALAGLKVTPVEIANATAKFDLTCSLAECGGELRGSLIYNVDLFDAETVARMARRFERLLGGIAENPEARISALPLHGEEESALLAEWNETQREYPRDETLGALFAAQVALTPGATALIFDGGRMTYAELNDLADGFAARLADVAPGSCVGLCAEREPAVIAAMIGILRAGCAYVPLDPKYPRERLEFMLDDTQMAAVFTTKPFAGLFSTRSIAVFDLAAPNPKAKVEDRKSAAACVIYTSGSTGTPKGVVVPHRAIARLVRNTNYADFGPGEVFLQVSPLSFDASTYEIWGALLNGGKLALLPPGPVSLADIGGAIRRFGVTSLFLTTGLFNAMVDERVADLRGVGQLLTGGEALSIAHATRALEALPETRLIHVYGPTESTTFTTAEPMTAADISRGAVPIGRPISNTRVFILDARMAPAPIGVPGELFIGGDGLALEYLRRPDLTAEKFVSVPQLSTFNGTPLRLYRSGDRARWLADGRIEFLGRLDRQLKIRGFRIEPGEIEAAICAHPAAAQCAVTCADGQRLTAYVAARAGSRLAADDLRALLRSRLPDYMIPAAFVVLDSLPLTANGKVDLQALPAPEAATAEFAAPEGVVEARLAELWERQLGRTRIGRHDNFFELGGHSLMALRMFNEMEKAFGRSLPLASLFRAPTISALAILLAEPDASSISTLVAIQPKGAKPPLFCIHGGDGGILLYRSLARHLGEERPIHGLEAAWLTGPGGGEESIEAIAASYVALVRAARPHGPYHLAGYSLGGVIAFEMAQQLRRAGEPVGLVAFFDTFNPARRGRRLSFTERIEMNRQFLASLDWAGKTRLLAWRAGGKVVAVFQRERGRVKSWAARLLAERGHELRGELHHIRGREAHVRALRKYIPAPYPGPVLLFVADNPPTGYEFLEHRGWDGLTGGGLEAHRITGAQHEAILDPPAVEGVAARLRARLAEADGA